MVLAQLAKLAAWRAKCLTIAGQSPGIHWNMHPHGSDMLVHLAVPEPRRLMRDLLEVRLPFTLGELSLNLGERRMGVALVRGW